MTPVATAFDVQKIREDFPILEQKVHGDRPLVFLDNAASTQRPRQVIEVLRRVYERDYANVHRGIHTLSERSTEQYEEAREKIRDFIGADSLGYLSLDGLLSSVGSARPSYCTSCYTGDYPVAVPQNQAAYLQLALKLVE